MQFINKFYQNIFKSRALLALRKAMKSLTVFVGVVALLLLAARRDADLERRDFVRTGSSCCDGGSLLHFGRAA